MDDDKKDPSSLSGKADQDQDGAAPRLTGNGSGDPKGTAPERRKQTDRRHSAAPDATAVVKPHPATLAEAKTRIRLAKTQNVIAVAKMNDGSTFIDRKEVKVTIGGCGG